MIELPPKAKPKSKPRPTMIAVDLLGYKEPFLALCRKQGISPSQAFRQIAAKLTATSPAAASTPTVLYEVAERPVRCHKVALTPSEDAKLEEFAKMEGFSSPKWLVALVRARIAAAPQFGQQEIEVLARSNKQLLAIGRNLNQIARTLNANPQGGMQLQPELVAELNAHIRDHTRKVSALVTANIERWRIE